MPDENNTDSNEQNENPDVQAEDNSPSLEGNLYASDDNGE